MELFGLTMPSKMDDKLPLYIRGSGFGFGKNKSILFQKNQTISLDTFFNLFSFGRYFKYTTVASVELRLKVAGIIKATLVHKAANGEENILFETQSDKAEQEIILPFDLEIKDGGFVYARLCAVGEGCVLFGGGYFADTVPQDIKLGVVICTYRREQYVKNNIDNIETYLKDNVWLRERLRVFVVDNGQTLLDQLPSFATLIPNKNLGGAGGFTRGILEVCERKDEGYTHFLLMDDDIEFEPAILYKTAVFASVLKPQYRSACIGAAMLPIDQPTLQYEMGAFWRNNKNKPNLSNLELADTNTLLKNELDIKVDYSAWWYYCMPVDVVDRVGLPLPIFIRNDDIEYSLRGATDVILLNGIAVWHESFNRKNSDWLEYYTKRNELIVCAMHNNGKSMWQNFKKAVRSSARWICRQRYNRVDLIFKAYDDFLKGVDWLADLDAESHHKTILKGAPKMLSSEELKEKYGFVYDKKVFDSEDKYQPNGKGRYLMRTLTLNGYLLPKFMYRKTPKVVDMIDARAVDFYKANEVIHFHPDLNVGFITKIRKTELIKTIFRIIKLYIKMLFCYTKIVKQYQNLENQKKLTTKKAWQTRFID